MMSDFPGTNWKLSSLSKLIWKTDDTGSCSRAKMKILSSDVNVFIKHTVNDITKNDVAKTI